jgi:hypothetical protein
MNEKPVYYRISQIDKPIISFPTVVDRKITNEDVEFQMSISLDFKDQQQIVTTRTKVFYSLKEPHRNILVADFSIHFSIRDYSEAIKKTGNTYNIPDNFLLELYNTSINTCRGYLFGVTQDHPHLGEVILGSVSPMLFLEALKKKENINTISK